MKLLLLFVLLTTGINTEREYHPISLKGDVIPVYSDSLAVYELCKLDNTRSHKNLDWFYYTLVDSQTSDMFHVATCLIAGPTMEESHTIQGWVYKIDCFVWLQADNYDENGNILKYLYEKPDSTSPETTLIITRINNTCPICCLFVEEIDLSRGSRWIKISATYEGKRYCGWTERYYIE